MTRFLLLLGVTFLASCSSGPSTTSTKPKPSTASAKEATHKPPETEQGAAPKDQLVSFNFQKAELKTVFELISRLTGMNIIYDAATVGTVTLAIQNAPAGEVLEAVVKTFNLNLVYSSDNTVRVVSLKKS